VFKGLKTIVNAEVEDSIPVVTAVNQF